jgi:hypothetical protein
VSKQRTALVAMRLIDMHKVHPGQTTMDCALCGEKVGVYPSGQKVLRLTPGLVEVICHVCAAKTYDPALDTDMPAGSINEIVQEVLDSKPVNKA